LAWTLKRLEISAIVVFHLVAVTTWIVPDCELHRRLVGSAAYYLMPLGQWQYWGMFAPDPLRDTVTLEALVLDAKGLLHTFAFPQEGNRSIWDAAWHYRHSKYAANFALKDEFKAHREFAARHAVRQLHLPPEEFPVEVRLVYQIKPTPPPGTLPDPMTPQTSSVIESYLFPTLEEVLP
jgi:hypothetical protein